MAVILNFTKITVSVCFSKISVIEGFRKTLILNFMTIAVIQGFSKIVVTLCFTNIVATQHFIMQSEILCFIRIILILGFTKKKYGSFYQLHCSKDCSYALVD